MLHLILKNRDSGESKVGGKVDSPTFACLALPKQNHLLSIFFWVTLKTSANGVSGLYGAAIGTKFMFCG